MSLTDSLSISLPPQKSVTTAAAVAAVCRNRDEQAKNSIDMIMRKKCLTVLTADCFCFVSLVLVVFALS